MRTSPILFGVALLAFAGAAPVSAQDSAAAADQTTAPADASVSQPTEKEAKELDHCKKMTAQQRAQSSKCTDLMKKFNIDERQQDPMAKGFGH